MIKNQREYKVTRLQLRRLKRALVDFDAMPAHPGVHPLLVQTQRVSLQGEIDKLRAELAEYEQLCSGKRRTWAINSLRQLPDVLAQARIAQQMTQRVLAERLGLPEQQVQRYESTGYRGVSWERLQEVAERSGLRFQIVASLPAFQQAITIPSREPEVSESVAPLTLVSLRQTTSSLREGERPGVWLSGNQLMRWLDPIEPTPSAAGKAGGTPPTTPWTLLEPWQPLHQGIIITPSSVR